MYRLVIDRTPEKSRRPDIDAVRMRGNVEQALAEFRRVAQLERKKEPSRRARRMKLEYHREGMVTLVAETDFTSERVFQAPARCERGAPRDPEPEPVFDYECCRCGTVAQLRPSEFPSTWRRHVNPEAFPGRTTTYICGACAKGE